MAPKQTGIQRGAGRVYRKRGEQAAMRWVYRRLILWTIVTVVAVYFLINALTKLL